MSELVICLRLFFVKNINIMVYQVKVKHDQNTYSVYESQQEYYDGMIRIHEYLEVYNEEKDEYKRTAHNNHELSIEDAKELVKALSFSIKDYEEEQKSL